MIWPRLRAVFAKAPAPRAADLAGYTGGIYAIGDVHGSLDLLKGLEAKICADAGRTEGNLLIYLGDMIDRGRDSHGVLAHVMAPPPPGFQRVCLMGNHEAMMLAFLDSPRSAAQWLGFGGLETLVSYGALESEIRAAMQNPRKIKALLERIIPASHMRFLRALPHMALSQTHMLAHAGGDPAQPIARQTVQGLLWGADTLFNTPPTFGKTIVHGHFITTRAAQAGGRIAIDTGAYASGVLSAVKLGPENPIKVFTYTRQSS